MSDSDLRAAAALYRDADVLVYPSLYEGFGLPPLEAMAAGIPVVAARSSCLPETLGDSAALVDPHDPDELAAAVERILTDSDARARAVIAGRTHAARFTWERCAAETCAVYRKVAGVPGATNGLGSSRDGVQLQALEERM